MRPAAASRARPTLLPRSFIMRMSLPSQFSRSLLGGGLLLHSDYATRYDSLYYLNAAAVFLESLGLCFKGDLFLIQL